MALAGSYSGTATTAISGTTETAIATTPYLQYVPGNTYAGMVIRGNLTLNPGINNTTVTARIRQGSATTTGTQVQGGITWALGGTVGSALGAGVTFPFEVVDNSATPATQYCVNLFGSGSSNGTVTSYEIEIDPIIP